MAKSQARASRGRLFTTTLLAGAAALGAPAAVGLLTALSPTTALAQDYTAGTLIGHVTDSSGAAVPGARATVRSQATGVSQTSTTDANGTFRAPLIPSGAYTVSITKDGFAPITQNDLAVRIGGESNYGFTLTTGNEVSEIVVAAKKPQPQLDFSQTTKGVSIDVEQLQKQVPIARNVTAVALLAPGVVTAVPGFTNTDGSVVPTIGGGSAGENSFYLNGLNITNFDTYIGAATVPFDFYKTIEVKTGGYPAEFGRATGGVINAVTKSGTNDLYFAVHGNYTPDFARELSPNTYTTLNSRARYDQAQTNVEFGGPLWRDHLFFYGLYQLNNTIQEGGSITSHNFYKQRSTSPFYGYKIDAFITSRQHVEFTDFNTAQTSTRNTFNLLSDPSITGNTSLAAQQRSGTCAYIACNDLVTFPVGPSGKAQTPQAYTNGGDAMGILGPYTGSTVYKNGGNNWVAKYTGTFTDFFTLSGAYGKSHDRSYTLPGGAGQVPYVIDQRSGSSVVIGLTPAANATTSIDNTARTFYRVDADLYVDFLGRHHFRAGYDNEDTRLNHTLFLTGGSRYYYEQVQSPEDAAANGFTDPNQEYLEVLYENLGAGGASVRGTNEAYYFQDSWDVTRQLNVQLGVRDDVFDLNNLVGDRVLNLKDNWAPRIAIAYDPFGHKTDKFFASYGRYFIPPASNLSFRGADFGGYEFFTPANGGVSYSSVIDPRTGVPSNLGTPITATSNPLFAEANTSGTVCPPGFAVPGVPACQLVYGAGIPEPAATKAAAGLEATHEDEVIVGYQKKFGSLWSASATVTYRRLGNVVEDIDNLNSAIENYCKRDPSHGGCSLGTDEIDAVIGANPDYALINVGKGATVTVRRDAISPETGALSPLAGQTFNLTKEDLGFPDATRDYYALELAFERAFDGKWSLNGSYTLSKEVGNYEGTVKSDAGNSAQTDAGSTEAFDYPGLTDYDYGLLPNHRAHQFKLFGSYQVLSGLLVGANFQATSPRHYGCFGYYPYPTNAGGYGGVDPVAPAYGNASRYCYQPALGYSVPTPRGDVFYGDWFYQMDVSVRYAVPKFSKYVPGNLVFRVDGFNIFNSQQVLQNSEVGNSNPTTAAGSYKFPIAYQTPRYFRFGFDYTF